MSNPCICGCNGDNTLLFSTKEINQILQDGIINCSTRYSEVVSVPLQLTLEEALPLIPDKFKSTCRLLIFLDKGEPPKPEIWAFSSKLVTDWLNLDYWVPVPIGFSGEVDDNINDESENPVQNKVIYQEFQKVIYSDPVRSIKVVEKAPGNYDDVLYLEYLPMESSSSYQITVPTDLKSPISEEEYQFPVNISTHILGEKGIDFSRLFIDTPVKPFDDAKVAVYAEYPEGVEYNFTNRGYIGNESTGFPLKQDEDTTINLNLTFTDKGEYSMIFKVINIDGGTTLAEYQYNFQVI